jgi:Reverse transcriptase (RNA-dependent DNA polymerase)
MAYCVSTESLELAIKHLCRYGDTDIFPHLPELVFLSDERDAAIAELSKLDLDSYTPGGALEALAPKSRYAFRIAHQLSALDTLLLLACVIEIGESIEAKRQPKAGSGAFSYRFSVDRGSGQIFRADRTFKDWLHRQQDIIAKNARIRSVISTDISDYYARVNFHRLENLLDEVAPKHGAARFIKRHIRTIRAKQSFGLPVGGSAARLLAELALSDTDEALKDRGILATRFVDDFRIFLKRPEDPYEALGYLAEQLGINEGLSLNSAKTSVSSRTEYVRRLDRLTSDVAEEAEGVALDALTASIYFDDEPDEDDIRQLKGLNLVELLQGEVDAEYWDMGRIKVIFRALRIVKPKSAIEFINNRFSDLLVFAKELCLLMEDLESDYPGCFKHLIDQVIDAILAPPASSVQLIRTWLIEIFCRGVIIIPPRKLKKLDSLRVACDANETSRI